MKIGVSVSGIWYATPVVQAAKAAEALGYESIWLGEHIIIPVHIKNPVRHGVPLPDFYKHLADPFIWLTAAAMVTNRVKLGTHICLVPQRNPLILAKEVASLDHISGGRFILGEGIGWIEEEADIMGYSFRSRGQKTVEHLRALKVLWTDETSSFKGDFVSFPPVYSYPKPLQKPHPPILIGAGVPEVKDRTPILRRVVEVADGWLPALLTPEEIAGDLKILRDLCAKRDRDFGALDITLLLPAARLGVSEPTAYMGALDTTSTDSRELIAEYEEAGVKRIILGLPGQDPRSYLQQLENAAKTLGLN